MTDYWLPGLAILIALVSTFLRPSKIESETAQKITDFVTPFLVVLVTSGILLGLQGNLLAGKLSLSTLFGLPIGALLLFALASVRTKLIAPVAITMTAALRAVVPMIVPNDHQPVMMGIAVGCLIALLTLDRDHARHDAASQFPIVFAAVFAVSLLLRFAFGIEDPKFLSYFMIAVSLASCLSAFFSETKTKISALAPWICAGLVSFGAWLIVTRFADFGTDPVREGMWISAVLGASTAAILSWLMKEDDFSVLPILISAILWLSLATVTFGYAKGTGIAVSMLSALTVLCVSRNRRAAQSMSILIAIVIYRLFRELFTDYSRAFDIGQHYGILGVVLGALIPLIALEWVSDERFLRFRSVGQLIWVTSLLAVPAVVMILLSSKGFVGWLVGLGLFPIFASLRKVSNIASLSWSVGLGMFSVWIFAPLKDLSDLTRDEKIKALLYIAGILAALIVLILAMRPKSASQSEEVA